MSEQLKFTEQEESELRSAMKEGGIFLKLSSNSNIRVDIEAADGNGSWKTIKTLGPAISVKINALYNNQNKYKAPVEIGFRRVSLSWFIASFC